jgi:hypothetical protein
VGQLLAQKKRAVGAPSSILFTAPAIANTWFAITETKVGVPVKLPWLPAESAVTATLTIPKALTKRLVALVCHAFWLALKSML